MPLILIRVAKEEAIEAEAVVGLVFTTREIRERVTQVKEAEVVGTMKIAKNSRGTTKIKDRNFSSLNINQSFSSRSNMQQLQISNTPKAIIKHSNNQRLHTQRPRISKIPTTMSMAEHITTKSHPPTGEPGSSSSTMTNATIMSRISIMMNMVDMTMVDTILSINRICTIHTMMYRIVNRNQCIRLVLETIDNQLPLTIAKSLRKIILLKSTIRMTRKSVKVASILSSMREPVAARISRVEGQEMVTKEIAMNQKDRTLILRINEIIQEVPTSTVLQIIKPRVPIIIEKNDLLRVIKERKNLLPSIKAKNNLLAIFRIRKSQKKRLLLLTMIPNKTMKKALRIMKKRRKNYFCNKWNKLKVPVVSMPLP